VPLARAAHLHIGRKDLRMNPQKLLEQFLGPNALGDLTQQAQRAKDQFLGGGGSGAATGGGAGPWGGAGGGGAQGGGAGGFLGGAGGFGGGLAAGGLLGVLLGNKGMRKMAGGLLGHGASAALGALAYRAYQNWQAGQQPKAALPATPADAPKEGSRFLPRTAGDGRPFSLALIRSMIAAAHADGHIGPEEQKQIFEAVNRAGLDADDKAFVFDALQNPLSPLQIAALAGSQEQAAELYLAARLAIDPDHPAEKAFLETLSGALNLPAGLVTHLDAQVAMA
jgi:uncharacterized membrane protein YebE (DUF533 family)